MIGGSSSSGSSVAHSAAPAPARAANVSSTCHDGSWNSMVRGMSVGHAARSAASLASSRRTPSGTRNRTVPSRSPNARYGPVSHGTLVVGSTPSARNEPPRCALTENRKSGRGRRDPGGHLDRGGRAVIGVVQLDGVEATGVVGEESGGGETLRIEARDPARVGEPARPGVQVSRHRSVSDRSSGPVPRRCRAGRRPGRLRRGRPSERPRSSPARGTRGRRRRRRPGNAR